MAKKRKTVKRAGKAKKAKKAAAKKSVKRKTAKRAAAKKPVRKSATAKRQPRKAKSESIGARLEHAMAAVLETLTDAERLHARVAAKGPQELE